ncbi:MAG: hypothetical protein IJ067_05850 [Prevotella sp.]|nr:hypothetical protein [Prevotella sp.]
MTKKDRLLLASLLLIAAPSPLRAQQYKQLTDVPTVYIDGESDKMHFGPLWDIDLSGRRIQQPTEKGIYIQNGRKIIRR